MTGGCKTPGPEGGRERRGSSRFPLLAQPYLVVVSGLGWPAIVEEIGGGGLVLRTVARTSAGLSGKQRRVRLRLGERVIRPLVQVLDCLEFEAHCLARARFVELSASDQRTLAAFLTGLSLERSKRCKAFADDTRTIGRFERGSVTEALTYHLIVARKILRMSQPGEPDQATLATLGFGLEAARQLIEAQFISTDGAPPGPGQDVDLVFDGPNALVHFESSVWRRAGERIWLTVPPALRAHGFRETLRVNLPPGRGVKLHFDHPRIAGLTVTRPVLDIGGRGVAIPVDPGTDALFPGERIDRFVLATPAGPVEASAIIRSFAGMPDGSLLRAGLELIGFSNPRHEERYKRFVFEASYPRIRLIHPNMVPKAWGALSSSGYVDLIPEEQRALLREQFCADWRECASDSNVGRFFLIFDEDRPVATAAANLLYPRTWLPHHFGVDRRVRARRGRLFDFARETYSGIMHLLSQLTSAEYFVFFFDAAKSWHDVAFRRFLDAYREPDDFVWDGFNLYRNQGPGPAQPAGVETIDLVDPTPRLLHALSDHLRRTLPKVEYEAFSYAEKDITLERFSRECAASGYERTRRIVFALRSGRPAAALIAETGSEGLNIFGLLNRCWIVCLEDEAGLDATVRAALLAKAHQIYGHAGKRIYLFLDGPGEPDDSLQVMGFHHEARGLRWLAHRRVIPAYLHYVREAMGILSEPGA